MDKSSLTTKIYHHNKDFDPSSWIVMDVRTGCILCQGIRFSYPSGFIYYPIEFKTIAFAQQWIDSGNIGEIQENHGNLKVGFTSNLFVLDEKPEYVD